jgi:hypothetical protein
MRWQLTPKWRAILARIRCFAWGASTGLRSVSWSTRVFAERGRNPVHALEPIVCWSRSVCAAPADSALWLAMAMIARGLPGTH